jgi:Flp pilus assembly protein CpaB
MLVGVVALIAMSGGGGEDTTTTPEAGADYGGDYGGAVDAGADTTGEVDVAATNAALSDAGPQDFSQVVIALQDLPRGFRLTDEFLQGGSPAVGLTAWPVSSIPLPQNSFTTLDELLGQNYIVRTDIPRESPILTTQLVRSYNNLGRTGSDAAVLLPPGLVAISMPLSFTGVGSVAFAMQPGDFVDVIFSFLFVEVDETFQSRQPNAISIITRDAETGNLRFGDPLEGRPEPSTLSSLGVLIVPQETQRPRLVTQRTVSGAYVLYVGFFPPDGRIAGIMSPTPFDTPTPNVEDGQPTPTPLATVEPTSSIPTIITLGVEPQDALVLTWAIDAQIPFSFALRSATDSSEVATTAVTLQYIIETYSIPNPPILPFSIEPAIRSVRSTTTLDLFSTFFFTPGTE